MAGFEGFGDLRFFAELARRQSRDWFLAHKSEYDASFAEPMKLLLAECVQKIDRAYPDCELSEPKLFRIHRDVRFSKDKSPYKTHVAGVVSIKLGASKMTETPAAIYLHLGVDGSSGKPTLERFAAAGLYMMDPRQLGRFREALLDEARGKEIGKIVGKLEKSGYTMAAAEELKKTPRGVDPEHPRAELIKRKGLIASFPAMPSGIEKQKKLRDWVTGHAKTVAPLVRWLVFNAC